MARPLFRMALWRQALRAGRGQGAGNSCAGPVVVGGLRQRRWFAGGLPPAEDRAPHWDAGPRRGGGGLPYGGDAKRVQVTRTEISHEVFEVSGVPSVPTRPVASERAPADVAGAEHSRGPERGSRGARHRTTPMSSLPSMRGSTSAARCVAYCTAETYGGKPLSYKAARSESAGRYSRRL